MEQLYKKIIDDTIKFVDSFNISESKFSIASKEINKIFNKKIRLNYDKEISMKELFENEEYATKDFYIKAIEELKPLKEKMFKINQKELIQFKEKIILSKDFSVKLTPSKLSPLGTTMSREYNDNALSKILIKKYKWAADAIKDFIDLKQEFTYLMDQDTHNTLSWKMIFKESFSLLDRLKTEGGLFLFNKINSDSVPMQESAKETLEFREKYNWSLPQDMLLNNSIQIVDSSKVIFSKLEIGSDGWVKFMLKKNTPISIDKNNNLLIMNLTETRNFFEHSFPTEFIQYFHSLGMFPELENGHISIKEQRKRISYYWQDEIVKVMMLFVYFLEKIDRYIKEELK